ncbi:hypothetical protein WA026_007062 [Henosepilachna vigintioctopunctata]|uniref:RNA 2-O ribose methyltransferase substrate binding domain-containing protein n=1 Tax=Henosepilachna vigintioctopunctata TaxID=420089 RepID=A0AAW1VBH1_9CUCU
MFVFKILNTNQLPKCLCYEQIRSLRWSSRIPKKVYSQAEFDENETLSPSSTSTHKEFVDMDSKKSNYPTTFSFQNKNNKVTDNNNNKHEVDTKILTLRKPKKKKNTTDMLETSIDVDGNLIYTKMHDNDARVAKILSNLKSDKTLRKEDSILLEGKRLITEALQSNCKIQYILFSKKSDVEELKPHLPKRGFSLYKMPYREMQMWSNLTTNPGIMGVFKMPEINQQQQFEIPLNVICDNIREPGNLGAILRTCAGVGCKDVILTKGCCDIWNSKVVRSAMGAHFKLRIQKLDWHNIKENLNNCNWFIADNNKIHSSKNSTVIIDKINSIPIESYDTLKYSRSNEITLVIGGETEGISEEAYSIVHELGGMRLHIPLANNIESLNSGTALSVLVFEIKRQIKVNT